MRSQSKIANKQANKQTQTKHRYTTHYALIPNSKKNVRMKKKLLVENKVLSFEHASMTILRLFHNNFKRVQTHTCTHTQNNKKQIETHQNHLQFEILCDTKLTFRNILSKRNVYFALSHRDNFLFECVLFLSVSIFFLKQKEKKC